MISDVLSQAADDIRVYLRRMPTVYAGCEPQICELLERMDALRRELDTPPSRSVEGGSNERR